MKILDRVPVTLKVEDILKKLHPLKEKRNLPKARKNIKELLEFVISKAKPKAVYEVSYVDNKNGDSLYINGIKFTSRVLRINLDKVERVFPYIVTCGKEIDEINIPSNDFMQSFLLDIIKNMVLYSTRNYLENHLRQSHALGEISRMSPGSLEDWPITQQRELFSIFGDVERLIGVKLTKDFLMIPIKSVSGIFFPTKIRFESCQLCPRERCIGRRAPYNPLLEEKYGLKCERTSRSTDQAQVPPY